MYNEKEFKSHITRLKIRKILYMLIFSILGSALGVVISDYIVDILLFNPILRVIIISVSTLLFFWFSLLITANTEKDVQDGYWKIAVLKKLEDISEKLDDVEKIKTLDPVIEGESISEIDETIEEENTVETIEENNYVETITAPENIPEILEQPIDQTSIVQENDFIEDVSYTETVKTIDENVKEKELDQDEIDLQETLKMIENENLELAKASLELDIQTEITPELAEVIEEETSKKSFKNKKSKKKK